MYYGNKLVQYTCMTAQGVCGIYSGIRSNKMNSFWSSFICKQRSWKEFSGRSPSKIDGRHRQEVQYAGLWWMKRLRPKKWQCGVTHQGLERDAMSNGSVCGNIGSIGLEVCWYTSVLLWMNTSTNPYHLPFLKYISLLRSHAHPHELKLNWTSAKYEMKHHIQEKPNPVAAILHFQRPAYWQKWLFR